MNKEKRGWRRHHQERKKRKAKTVYGHDERSVKLANNMKNCSCSMCGNPRRVFGELTLQEEKAIDSFVQGLADTLDKNGGV